MQEHYTKLKSDGREETYGEKHTFNTHYLKMNMLHEEGAPDLKAFLDWHVAVLDQFYALKLTANATWSAPKQAIA